MPTVDTRARARARARERAVPVDVSNACASRRVNIITRRRRAARFLPLFLPPCLRLSSFGHLSVSFIRSDARERVTHAFTSESINLL